MNYRELGFHNSYISQGNNNIADSFLVPALKCTKEYRRSVGFFSSGVFDTIMDGIVALVRNKGKIKLIASPKLSEEDAKAIELGYEQREKYITDKFTKDFEEEIAKLQDVKLQLLCELISRQMLDIKIAVTDGSGIYHDKLGILEDFDGNKMAFYGSSNSSYSGYRANYEKVRIAKNWISGFEEIVEDEELEFDRLWHGENVYVSVYNYTQIAERKLLEIVEQRKNGSASDRNLVKLRDYQEKAIRAWKGNDFHGFYVMATGTGKTWTAIFSAKELLKEHKCLITICAPYKHLVKQWAEDVEKMFPDAKIILVSSENSGWDKQISDAIIRLKSFPDTQIIVISTIASFKMQKFDQTISKFKGKKLLIVDEAHRFSIRPDNYEYMLGLSATPFSGTSAQKGNELMQYFGGQVFSLPIEEALGKYLVPYHYKPIYVYATKEEENQFNKYSKTIISCFKGGKCIDADLLVRTLRNRLRVISMAEAKQKQIDEIISNIKERDHIVVYCGDGKLFDDDTGEELRHIKSVKKALDSHGYKPSQFTATENIQERMSLVDSFNKGEITALAAIRCLDEGINIPSIKSALILSSNDDYREFVQRRGRILRLYQGKEEATIYDIIVLPSDESTQWATIELRRFLEYSRLSLDWAELKLELEELLLKYGIDMECIDVYDYEDMEVEQDE